MGVVERVSGFLRVEAVGAETEELLNLCADQGVHVRDCTFLGDYTLRFKVPARQHKLLKTLAERTGAEIKVLQKSGVPLFLRGLRRRVILFAGLLAALTGLLISGLHIWEIEIKGNERLTDSQILYALEDCGVSLGSFWPSIDQDLLRGRVMAILPELSFITVNIYGSRAEVVVRERVRRPDIYDEGAEVNIVAEKAGIISEIRAYRGDVRVSPGQTVLPGEVLVSGLVLGLDGFEAEHAAADIKARTWYEFTAAAPLVETQKSYTGRETVHTALMFGKTRINFYSGTGIPYANCDKIIKKRVISLRGIFTLPVWTLRERVAEYELLTVRLDETETGDKLERQLFDELRNRLGAKGEIVSYSFTRLTKGDAVYVTIRAECLENIAIEKPFTDEDYELLLTKPETEE